MQARTTMEKELEEQLTEAGAKLMNPPSAIADTLYLLDQIESCLSRVEQSPSNSMSQALVPSMTALVRGELLRHSDTDVRVAVASCISEITRITAPDAPYDDTIMKEIFQMIVAAFEDLSDIRSPSFPKRVSILETVAKVRSCVVMLDLECDALILDMFDHFINSIRDDHSDSILTAMETIMTLVLEESEEIPSEISSFLLSCLRKDNQDVLPIARSLAEKVISNCAAKLKPFLVEAIQSMGTSLNEYSEVITSICQESSENLAHNDVNACEPHLADERKVSGCTQPVEPPQGAEKLEHEATAPVDVDTTLVKSLKSRMSNGTVKAEKEETLVDPHSPNKKSERSRRIKQSKTTVAAAKAERDTSDPQRHVVPEATPDHSSKRTRARKSDSLTNSTEISDLSHEKEIVEPLNRKRGWSKEAESSTPQGTFAEEPTLPSEHDKKMDLSSPVESNKEAASIASPTMNQSLPDTGRPKRGRSGPKVLVSKGDEKPEGDLPVSPQEPKGTLLGKEDKLFPSADANSTKEPAVNKMSEAKPGKGLGKKGDSDSHESVPLVEEHQKEKPKGRKGEDVAGKGVTGESTKKKIAPPPTSAEKKLSKDQNHSDGTPRTTSKRKSVSGKKEAAEPSLENNDLGENLVGSKIKVWWPDDKKFYGGVVESFDPIQKKHKILYTDGDTEILLLKKEKWRLIGDDFESEKGTESDFTIPDSSTEKPPKKKAKTSLDSLTEQTMPEIPLKKGGSSTGKSKSDTPRTGTKPEVDTPKTGSKPKSETSKVSGKKSEAAKSSGKLKLDASKIARKSRSETPKADSDSSKGGKRSKSDNPKTVSKPKPETPKTGSKPEPDTPKTVSRSKTDTIKAGSKSKTGTPKSSSKPKADSAKTSEKSRPDNAETDDEFKADAPKSSIKSKVATPKSSSKSNAVVSSGKGKSGTDKAQESEAKTGKKRQRGAQG